MKLTQRLTERARTGSETATERLESDTPAAEPDTSATDTAEQETAPRGRPVVEHARILDGEHVWMAVSRVPARSALALQPQDGGPSVPLLDESGDDDASRLAVCAALVALPPRSATYDVVALAPSGEAVPVWTPALPDLAPMKVPASRDGRWQHRLRRGDDGVLQVVRRPADPGVDLVSVGLHEGRIVLRIAADPVSDTVQLTRSEDDEVEVELTGSRDDHGLLELFVTLDDLPLQPGLALRARCLGPAGLVPVRRRRNSLADPSSAVVLPALYADDERPTLRVRFDGQGRLVLKQPPLGPEA